MSKFEYTINHDNEQLILSYLMHNLDKVDSVKKDYFFTNISKTILESLQSMRSKNLSFNIDTLLATAKHIKPKEAEYFTYNIINDIYKNFDDFSNIEYHFKLLEDNWLKNGMAKNLIEDILTKSTQRGGLDTDSTLKFAQELTHILSTIDSNENALQTTESLKNIHLKTLDGRISGEIKRSLGFSSLDERCAKPAAAEEITLVYGRTGSGKSAFVKNVENILINKGVPVVSFNLEMSQMATVDRLICIRENISLYSLHNPDQRTKKMIENSLSRFSKLNNYLLCPLENLTFSQIDAYMYKAKDHFRKHGLLDQHEYVFITIDLLSMVKDFKERTPTDIENAMNLLHALARKHKCHVMAVVQANENKTRGKMFKHPDELDDYHMTLEDIKGGSEYGNRSRLVLSLHRPIYMKKQFFPELNDLWKIEPDYLYVHAIKHNDGITFLEKMIYGENFRVLQLSKEQQNA